MVKDKKLLLMTNKLLYTNSNVNDIKIVEIAIEYH